MTRTPQALVLELTYPVRTDDGWLVAVYIDHRRPDVRPGTKATPVYVEDLEEWQPT